MRTPRLLPIPALLLAACAHDPAPPAATPSADPTPIEGPAGLDAERETPSRVDELAAALSTPSYRVDVGGFVHRAEHLPTRGRRLVTPDATLEVYPFEDARRAARFAVRISPDGRHVDGKRFPWLEATHFWLLGRHLILLRGVEPTLMARLDRHPSAIRLTERMDQADPTRAAARAGERVRRAVATRLETTQGALRVREVELVRWEAPCEALQTDASTASCAEPLLGWRVPLDHHDQPLIARTDLMGARLAIEGS